MSKSIKHLIVLFLLVLVLLLPYFVFAQEAGGGDNPAQKEMTMKSVLSDVGRGAGYSQDSNKNNISSITATIIQAFLGLLGIIFVLLLIYGGYLWMTARGNEEQVNKAKENLKMATIGLLIILAAYSITYFVFTNLPFKGATEGGGSQAQPPTPE